MLKQGDTAPDFALTMLDGQPVSMRQILQRGSNVLLVFLRHLG